MAEGHKFCGLTQRISSAIIFPSQNDPKKFSDLKDRNPSKSTGSG